MTVWRYIVPNSGMGERKVPAPKTAFLMGEPSGNVTVKASGTWIHEEDWPYLDQLKFPCKGIMKKGLAVGCPDAIQMTAKPPEPPVEPPAPFFEIPDAFDEEMKAIEPEEEKPFEFYRNRKKRERS